ncbi:hypothetical protein RJ639_047820 [Escallonia herrerae]|uniref:Ataxin-10 domain-containing protein n=1 Tax=Escallonia herrerae TaxID=1293975 RepID=A0AA88W3U2_9ASTE|nr:hypothetical protein RJ639_047820 [Escallonia herrerae]
MDDTIYVPENILQPLFSASKTSSLPKALESLIEIARGTVGRSELASKNVLPTVLQLCHSLSNPACGDLLLLSLKLLRNLCAGELSNQNSFIKEDGVQIVSRLFSCITFASDMNYGIVRMGLQVLGNISLAGEEHQRAVWHQFFPLEFAKIARVRSRDTCDPLCMVIYTCYERNNEFSAELCSDQGLDILTEIIRTASAVGFMENWLKLLISRSCLEDSHSGLLFSKLCQTGASGNGDDIMSRVDSFVPEQAFFLSLLSEILNEQMRNIAVSNDFALFVLEVFRNSARIVESFSQVKSGLPTGSADIDVLGYSLTILRDICACDGVMGKEGSMNTVDLLLSSGLLELLLNLLCDLEPPALIRKATDQVQNQEAEHSYSRKLCPYKGFRRDLVAVIGNFTYQRKHVQDEIRQKNGILLLLQQCVTDDENPFLREWGIWSVRNLLEGNVENQCVVSELELQGSVNVPEIAGLGLRVEVDEKTRRAKLVNVS